MSDRPTPTDLPLEVTEDQLWALYECDPRTIGMFEHRLLPEYFGQPHASLWWTSDRWHYGCGGVSWGSGVTKGEAILAALRSGKR